MGRKRRTWGLRRFICDTGHSLSYLGTHESSRQSTSRLSGSDDRMQLRERRNPAALPLSMKETVQLAMQQNPQRLIARLAVNERRQDKTITQSALVPQVNVVDGESLNGYNSPSILGGPKPVRVGPFRRSMRAEFSLNLFNLPLTRRYQASREDVPIAIFLETTEREQITALIAARDLGILRAANRDAAASRVELAERLYDQARQLQKTGVGTDMTRYEHRPNSKTRSSVASCSRQLAS
jgi:outer membrane protein TolC